jgi:hypothetical protein
MNKTVKKRETFYLSGYDPRGARYYYNLYKREAKNQTEINGMKMDISSRRHTDKHIQSWKIVSETNDYKTQTNYHFLEWDDIIRKEWIKNIFSLFVTFFYFCKYYIFSGALYKTINISPQQVFILLYPALYVLFTIILIFISWYYLLSFLNDYIYFSFSFILSFGFIYFLLKILLKYGESISVHWLLSDYVFAAKYIVGENTEFSNRLELFGEYIIKKLKKFDSDEILLVTHSIGAVYLMPILKQIITSSKLSSSEIEKISILTLGEFIPLVLFLKKSSYFHQDMKLISQNKNLYWLDFTALADGISFSLYYFKCISLHVNFKQLFLSPRFHILYEAERYRTMKKKQFTFHFLYLMSTDKKGNYDFFKMTAGSSRLSSIKFNKKDFYQYGKN